MPPPYPFARAHAARYAFSFRQLLLIALMTVILIIGGALARTLVVVERLAAENRAFPATALAMIEDVRELQERTVAMERLARQYLVLFDAGSASAFREAAARGRQAATDLQRDFPAPLRALATRWLAAAARVGLPVSPGAQTSAGSAAMLATFHDLGEINQQMTRDARAYITARNQALVADLEGERRALMMLGGSAAALATVLALGFGVWLSRAFAQIARAIDRLGAGRTDLRVAIGGPADVRALGERIDWLRQRLAALEADKQLFLRHISHELKTPLGNLREGIALLDDQVAGPLNLHQREVIEILRDNAHALQAQIESLLQYNAAAFEARRLHRTDVDLAVLLGEVVAGQRLQIEAAALTVVVQGQLRASVDAEKLRVAVGNLLLNALRFSPHGGRIVLAVATGDAGPGRTADAPGSVVIDCIDEGPGVDPADADRIFQPFYQGVRQAPGARKGSGVGLSIVKELVDAHGGRVSLLPAPVGAHFRIEIPLEH